MNPWPHVLAFLVAALAGAALATVELLRTFQRDTGSALRCRWGLALLGLNAASALGVYAIVRYVLGVQSGIWTALVVGVTFPLLIRSRFTFYRQPGSKDEPGLAEFSLKVDEFYQTLQDYCYSEVNLFLAGRRMRQVEAIKERFTPRGLENELRDLIASEPMPDRRAEHLAMLEEILALEDRARREHALALLLVDLSTRQRIRTLTQRS